MGNEDSFGAGSGMRDKKKSKGVLGGGSGRDKSLAGYELDSSDKDQRMLKLHTKRQESTVMGDKARRCVLLLHSCVMICVLLCNVETHL